MGKMSKHLNIQVFHINNNFDVGINNRASYWNECLSIRQ